MLALRAKFSTGGIYVPNCSICNVAWISWREAYAHQTSCTKHQRDHAYHSSAKLDSHQQSRYHRYVRFAMGPHHRYNFLGWLLFQSCRCLVLLDSWNLLCLFFMMTSRLWCWIDRSWWSLYQHVVHGLIVLSRHIVVLAKYLVAKERWQSLIDGCNNDRWPNDTC